MRIIQHKMYIIFDDLIKNVENNPELKEFIFDLIINGEYKSYNVHSNIINLGYILGYLKNDDGKTVISNSIFEQLLYNYFSFSLEEKSDMSSYNYKNIL